MSCWIDIFDRVIKRICISIERHGIPRIGHNGIRLGEASEGRSPPSDVVHQTEVGGVAELTCKRVGGG